MSANSIIFTALACFALILLIITVAILNRTKGGMDKASEEDAEYINDQIYVGNLPYRVDENDLQSYFSRFGAIQGIRIVRNFRTGRSKGYAFVTYANPKQAAEALAAHGVDLFGRSMVVRIAKPRQQQHAF
jgi:RNA recognition motif-containing protein